MKNSQYAGETSIPSTPGIVKLNEIIYLCSDCPSLIEIHFKHFYPTKKAKFL